MSSHPFFGPNLKLLRARRGRSQEEVAIALDVKRSSWSGYENGSAEPQLDLLVRISGYFKVSLDKLLKDDLTLLSESQLGILERGGDVDLSGRRLRVLATGGRLRHRGHRIEVDELTGLVTAAPQDDDLLEYFRCPFNTAGDCTATNAYADTIVHVASSGNFGSDFPLLPAAAPNVCLSLAIASGYQGVHRFTPRSAQPLRACAWRCPTDLRDRHPLARVRVPLRLRAALRAREVPWLGARLLSVP